MNNFESKLKSKLIKAFEELNYTVVDTSSVGGGVGDLIIFYLKQSLMIEIKVLPYIIQRNQINYYNKNKGNINYVLVSYNRENKKFFYTTHCKDDDYLKSVKKFKISHTCAFDELINLLQWTMCKQIQRYNIYKNNMRG